jgi:hypothetical protein
MAAKTAVRRTQAKPIRIGLKEARPPLVDRLEAIEQSFQDSWHGANAAVRETAQGVQAVVETMVRAVVQDAGQAAGRLLDFPVLVRRHPWLMVGGAFVLGLAAADLAGRP